MTSEHRQRTQIKQVITCAGDASQRDFQPLRRDAPRDDVETRGVERERGQDDSARPGQEARRAAPGDPDDRVQMPRNRSISGQRLMAVADRPAVDRASCEKGGCRCRTPPRPGDAHRTSIVVPLQDSEAHFERVEPVAEPAQIGGGPGARSRRLDQVASHDQPCNRRASEQSIESRQGLVQRVSRDAVSGGAPGPFITEVHIGDHRGSLPSMDRRPLRRELPRSQSEEARFPG